MKAIALLWLLGAGIAERGELRVLAAEAALDRGDARQARQELAAAWVYLGSSLYDEAWRGEEGERRKQQERWQDTAGKLRALEVAPSVLDLERTAREALAVARASRRPRPALFQSAASVAGECTRAVPAEARTDWSVPGQDRPLAEVVASCRALIDAAHAEAAQAEQRARARDAELRAVLRGERLELYERFGDPEPGMAPPLEVARAQTWKFIVGPRGALRAYETWVFDFRGDHVVEKRRTETRESP